MNGSTDPRRTEQLRTVRRGERTIEVRVVEYRRPRVVRPAAGG